MWHKDCVPDQRAEGDTELGVPVVTEKPLKHLRTASRE